MLRIFIAFLFLVLPVQAEEIVADLSQARVSITANFDGSEILLFGAIRREAPIPSGDMGIIVTVEGPKERLSVRRKDKRFGIWVNVDAVEVDAAPSFYAIATTGPLDELLSGTEDLRHSITIPRAIRAVGESDVVDDVESFTEALIRIRKKNSLYQLLESQVRFAEGTLFDASFALPSNLTEGDYRTRIFLTRDGAIIDQFETSIAVNKVGLERFIFNLAHERPLIYGLLSLAIAIAAGWLASAFFRYLRS